MNSLTSNHKPGFFKISRELRDKIYLYYFTLDNGYTYNHESKQLRSTNEEPYPLALSSVSRQVRQETVGLALEYNDLHFHTYLNPALYINKEIGHYDKRLKALYNETSLLLLGKFADGGCFTHEVCRFVEKHYPKFAHIANGIRNRSWYVGKGDRLRNYAGMVKSEDWKEIPSLTRDFVLSTLRYLFNEPCGQVTHLKIERIFEHLCRRRGRFESSLLEPWNPPTNWDFADLERIVPETPGYWEKEKYRLSAACLAIEFLARLSDRNIRSVRKIHLDEDHPSIAWPECHARGLIPFAKGYPDMSIVRNVSLWRNILPGGCSTSLKTYMTDKTFADFPEGQIRIEKLLSADVSAKCLAPWIMEATALPSLGMPEGSFKMILDGQLIPERSTEMFDVARVDAQSQLLFEKDKPANCSAQQNWLRLRQMPNFIMFGFPQAIRDIVNGTSLIHCNFHIPAQPNPVPRHEVRPWEHIRPYDDMPHYKTLAVLEPHRSRSLEDWECEWRWAHEEFLFDTEDMNYTWADLPAEASFICSRNSESSHYKKTPDVIKR
ncbi:hypothetical protein PTNB73_10163 [Pyrenophora teres f. teres]|uniref:Uncharacterized protein n=1 Tax=Pyrenophora teres f. teres TaxID=97479 RepID=A0A6S6VL92_9PLEO|nr:hypothetical protein PTNB85_09915 [Pyrenophora teres f. teres]KAE8852520.1 hypothetical protein PTNB29_10421 [Pyrenophora teres f. teres]KAE8853073.1 hypothetical protein HRS9122_00065 [Pyrenophora teres f. teres]KAE8855506.1 hypothetical protein PTNB73_10163 [Pyrenophora teres f. teres]CAE7020516.1 hypothetical protein PTTW11_03081 [Pyrenophora teres f. teres]